MATGLTALLGFLSETASVRVAATARRVAAIRIGTHQHICATLWSPDYAITCSRFLPRQDQYLLLLDGRHAVGQVAWTNDELGLTALKLDVSQQVPSYPVPRLLPDDSWVVSIGIDTDGTPIAGLTVLQGTLTASGSRAHKSFFTIDRDVGPGDVGGPLIAPSGALVGILSRASIPEDKVGLGRAIPSSVITRIFEEPHLSRSASMIGDSEPDPAYPHDQTAAETVGRSTRERRAATRVLASTREQDAAAPQGWLGVELQPTNVPRELRAIAGQKSGRMVTDIAPNGPADMAGLQWGDIVLTIENHSMVGSGAVRDFLAQGRIGDTAEMILLRGGELISVDIVIARRPPE